RTVEDRLEIPGDQPDRVDLRPHLLHDRKWLEVALEERTRIRRSRGIHPTRNRADMVPSFADTGRLAALYECRPGVLHLIATPSRQLGPGDRLVHGARRWWRRRRTSAGRRGTTRQKNDACQNKPAARAPDRYRYYFNYVS